MKEYLRGIGVGLIISWVTGTIAYLKGNPSAVLLDLILFQLVLSGIFILVSYLVGRRQSVSRR